ncbi:hypothetical protein PG997_009323 [Apiospora hydei]|uniref:Uncharacterized protein n=1 Tax=Apiospora hydei TaxID=1337664 RepID=A0ABR1VWY7_9PEZI
MSEPQNGIDILCDAAGPDLLLSTFLPASSSPQEELRPPPPSSGRGAKRIKIADDASPSVPAHVCHICKRVYERFRTPLRAPSPHPRRLRDKADYENARPYQCSRCPKRFNRADLLTRHETTHDRDDQAQGRPVIRRSDRAAEACLNCAASKAKCDDQKPCGRCRSKSLVCQTATRKTLTYGTPSEARGDGSIADSPESTNNLSQADQEPIEANNNVPMQHYMGSSRPNVQHGVPYPQMEEVQADTLHVGAPTYLPHYEDAASHHIMNPAADDMFFYNPTHNNFFQDMDFTSWDLNFDSYTIPQVDIQGPSPQSSSAASVARHARLPRDPSRGHAAFKRSPWLWEPKSRDNALRESESIAVNEESIAGSPAYEKILASSSKRLKMGLADRDRLFAIVLAQRKNPLQDNQLAEESQLLTEIPLLFFRTGIVNADPRRHSDKSPGKVPSFPSLDLLNYLLQTHFVHDEYETDNWIHAASLDPSTAMPELLAMLVASGAGFIAVPSIWQFGLALQEVVRTSLSILFESRNAYTRDLQCLQAFMQILDIGLWSGFKRKMEIAESFLQPVMTMLRRAGTFSAPADTPALVPTPSDTPELLESKWRKFIKRESYKRLVLHLFFHDVQASIALQKNPLMTYTELCFSLPASRDLWRASSAEAWRNMYLRKKPLAADTTVPRISDIMNCMTILEEFEDFIDVELCYAAALYGFWGQIASYREAVRFYGHGTAAAPRLHSTMHSSRNATHRLWLTSMYQELYRDINEFSTLVSSLPITAASGSGSRRASTRDTTTTTQLYILVELFMMILHVHPDDLQRFAGKYGEDEARHAAMALEDPWAGSRDARHAVWHAGQVFRHARALPPASLRGFHAIAVYFASLTLWVYGLLSCSYYTQGQQQQQDGVGASYSAAPATSSTSSSTAATSAIMPPPPPTKYVLLDGDESRETRAFLQLDKGIPGLSTGLGSAAEGGGGAESLSNPGMVLDIARNVFRENYPVRSEPLPPLVESLGNLLRDLGTGLAGRPSRVPSRAASETPSG